MSRLSGTRVNDNKIDEKEKRRSSASCSMQAKRQPVAALRNKANSNVNLFTETINVIVRCRGRGFQENEYNSPNVVSIPRENSTEIKITVPDNMLNNNPHKELMDSDSSSTRTYTLDKVYGPATDQMTFFQHAAENICEEFLKGFNCTIFAYGQTGAGKTYTMCGKVVDNSLTPESGIIPRCLNKLFESSHNNNREDNNNSAITLKCSFVEIYNETLKDLLSDGKNDKNLKIFEHDKSIKIKALEEYYIKDFEEAMKMFKIGLDRKKTASTKMNDVSSRSHTIFTIYLMKKRPNASEYQFAKMNLVDLAGSENINRSGSTNQRAKEAGSINQSLLTLGRVINSLVDGSSFIPYRESKLTRLLQDSLGGKTKTILVANIAPTLINLQASISTLEYASKAKNIKNSAQIGTTISEEYILNDLIEENRKLKLDLLATRRKENCIIMDDSNYKEMYLSQKTLKDEVEELRGFRLSLLNQLDNQMKKINNEKTEKQILNQTIQTLESKMVNYENKLRQQQETENSLKQTINNLYLKFNTQLSNIYESQIDTRSILSNNILNCFSAINSKLQNQNHHFDYSHFTVLETELKDIKLNLDKLIQIDDNLSDALNRTYSKLITLNKDLSQSSDEVIKNINDLTEVVDNNDNNENFIQFANKFLSKQEPQLLEMIEEKIRDRVTEFKNEMNKKVDELVFDNLEYNYNEILKYHRSQLDEKTTAWIKNSDQIKLNSNKARSKLIVAIQNDNSNVSSVVDNCIKEMKDSENNVLMSKQIVNLLNDKYDPLCESIDCLQDNVTRREGEVKNYTEYVKGSIQDLKPIVESIINKNNVDLEKEKGQIFSGLDNMLKSNKPNKLNKSSKSNLNSPVPRRTSVSLKVNESIKHNTPTKSPVFNLTRTPNKNSPFRSPFRSPHRSPTRNAGRTPNKSPSKSVVAFGLKRSSSTIDDLENKRQH